MPNDYLIKRAFNKYLLSSILMILAATLGMIIDSVVVSNILGGLALQAMIVASPIFFLLSAVASLVSQGGTTLAAIYFGKNQPDRANEIFTLVWVFSGIVSVVLMILGFSFMTELIYILGGKGELTDLAKSYGYGLLTGAFPIIICYVVIGFTRADSNPKLALLCVLIMSVVNISLDFILVFVFNMGMFGIGLATSIGYLAALLVGCIHFFTSRNSFRFSLKALRTLSKVIDILNQGMPGAITMFASTGRTWLINATITFLGVSGALTAFAVISNVNIMVLAVLLGIGNCIAPMIGIFAGEGDDTAINYAIKNALKTGLLISIVTSFIVAVLADPISRLFNVSDITMTVNAIRLYSMSFPLSVLNLTLMIAYQSSGRPFLANIISVCKGFLFVAVSIFLFIGLLKEYSIWLSFLMAELLTYIVIVLVVGLKTGRFTLIPSRLFLSSVNREGRIIDISIANDLNQVTSVSEKIQNFCLNNGVPAKKAYYIALGTEEMAGNVVYYGFKDNKEHFLDIRLIITDNELTLRIRDDGIRFNPLSFEWSQNDKNFYNIGINMVKGIAKSVDYRYSVGLNNLIIRL